MDDYPEYDAETGMFYEETKDGYRIFEPGTYPWDKFLDPNTETLLKWLDTKEEKNSEEILAMSWAETEKRKNESIGYARGTQVLAMQEFFEIEKSEKTGKTGKKKFFWVTINPTPDTDLKVFEKTMVKCFSKKWVEKSAFVLENTGTGHIHAHGLILTSNEPGRSKREIANTVSSFCRTDNSHCYVFVVLPDEKTAHQKFDYILGKKQDHKQSDVELTKTWRKLNELKDVYYYPEGSLNLLEPSETKA